MPATEATPLVAKPATKLEPVEGLRAILTMIIIVFHLNLFGGMYALIGNKAELGKLSGFEYWFFWLFTDTSDFVVNAFLVISGFFTQYSNKQVPRSFIDRMRFVVSRYLRLAPAYYFSLILSTVGWVIIFNAHIKPSSMVDWWHVPQQCLHQKFFPAVLFVIEFFMLQGWLPLRNIEELGIPTGGCVLSGNETAAELSAVKAFQKLPSLFSPQCHKYPGQCFNIVDWFVSCLLICFVIHALIGDTINYYVSTPLRGLLGAATCTVVRILLLYYAPWETHNFDYVWHFGPAVYPAFLAGVCTARVVNTLPSTSEVRSWRLWMFIDTLILIVFGVLVSLANNKRFGGLFGLHCSFFALPLVSVFCLLCTCDHHGLVLRFLALPALASLGPMSYATYLVQYFWLFYFEADWSLSEPLTWLITIGACFLTGTAFHYAVERPLGPALKRFEDWLFSLCKTCCAREVEGAQGAEPEGAKEAASP